MKHDLILVTLNQEQIARAKELNGKRKQITHALICGPYGKIFGTEKQCLKYFSAWDPAYRWEVSPGKWRKGMFPKLFGKAVRTDEYEISDFDFESTPDLTTKLIELDESVNRR